MHGLHIFLPASNLTQVDVADHVGVRPSIYMWHPHPPAMGGGDGGGLGGEGGGDGGYTIAPPERTTALGLAGWRTLAWKLWLVGNALVKVLAKLLSSVIVFAAILTLMLTLPPVTLIVM